MGSVVRQKPSSKSSSLEKTMDKWVNLKNIFRIHNGIVVALYITFIVKTNAFALIGGSDLDIAWKYVSAIIYLTMYATPMVFVDLFFNGSWYDKPKSITNIFLFMLAIFADGLLIYTIYTKGLLITKIA